MNIFTDKYGNIRTWAAFTGYGLLAIGFAALIVGGIILLAKARQYIIENAPAPLELEYETITVASKEERPTGMTCFKMIVLNCSQNYDYYVNGKKTNKQIYEAVEEGKTYFCEKNRYSNGYNNCKEVKNEK